MPDAEPWTRELGRILAVTAMIMNGLVMLHPRVGKLGPILWIPKLLAGAWAPFLGALGLVGAALSALHLSSSSPWPILGTGAAMAAGVIGFALGVAHTIQVTAPHTAFADTFGQDWEDQIPAELRSRLQGHRYRIAPPNPPRVPWEEDVAFGASTVTGQPLYANIWLPPAGVPRTGLVVLYIYGGAWHFFDKDMGTRRFFRHLAAQGHVVMDTSYTLAPDAHLPEMIADVKQAILWMKQEGEQRYGIDPERLVLCGCSSGAQMALLTAFTPNHPALQPRSREGDTGVCAVVSFSGIPDLRTAYPIFRDKLGNIFNPAIPLARWVRAAFEWACRATGALSRQRPYVDTGDWIPSMMGGTPEELPDAYDLGSPIHHVSPRCPPTLLFQGAHDFTGILPDVKRLHRALCEAGVPAVYIELPKTDHAFDITPINVVRMSAASQSALYDLDRFLALLAAPRSAI